MLLYASIESHCIVQLTSTEIAKTSRGEGNGEVSRRVTNPTTSYLTIELAILTARLKFLHLNQSNVAMHFWVPSPVTALCSCQDPDAVVSSQTASNTDN